MKNIFILILIIFSACAFAQCNEGIIINYDNYYVTGETDYNQIEKRVYNQLKTCNEECLNLMNLTPKQKESIYDLQKSYLETAKKHGAELRKVYIEYNEAYKRDPNSKTTKQKENKLKETVAQTKKDYYEYQSHLFKILNKKQIKIYNEYMDRKVAEAKEKWRKHKN